MPESGSSGHVLVVLDWASLASSNNRSQVFREHLTSGSSTEGDLSLQIVTNPDSELFFFKAVIVSVFGRRSAPSDQRRPTASAFRSSTLMMSTTLTRSATMRSSTWDLSCLARMRGGVLVLRRSHDAIPIFHLVFFFHTMCCHNSKLATWEVARRVMRQNRLWEPSDRTMLDFRNGGAMSREGVTHRPRLSTPSPKERVQSRTVERNFDVPCGVEQIVDVLGRRRNNLELACSTEVRDSSPSGPFFFVSFFFCL